MSVIFQALSQKVGAHICVVYEMNFRLKKILVLVEMCQFEINNCFPSVQPVKGSHSTSEQTPFLPRYMEIHYCCWQTKCHKICHTNHIIRGSKILTTLTVVFSKWLLSSVLSMLMSFCTCKRAMWLRQACPRSIWAKFPVSARHWEIAQLL